MYYLPSYNIFIKTSVYLQHFRNSYVTYNFSAFVFVYCLVLQTHKYISETVSISILREMVGKHSF
jgi:hypothetical protein